MWMLLIGVIIGGYAIGALFSALIMAICTCIDGGPEDWWKPFIYSIGWPVLFPLYLFKG